MRIEQNMYFVRRLRQMRSDAALIEIRAQKCRTNPAMPRASGAFDGRQIFGANDDALSLTGHRGKRRVMERAEHTGDVAQGASLDAPLAQWTRRLAFEIDDDEIVAGV